MLSDISYSYAICDKASMPIRSHDFTCSGQLPNKEISKFRKCYKGGKFENLKKLMQCKQNCGKGCRGSFFLFPCEIIELIKIIKIITKEGNWNM